MASQPPPWERYGGAAPAGSPPPIIQGPPRLPPPQTDVNAARDRVALDAERQRLALQQAQIERERLAAAQAGRVAADPAGDAPATQRRDAGFYLRATRSNGLYEQHQVAPRGVVGQTLADTFPRIANAAADPERQMAEAAQADFIGATLRYESGAAVPPAEFEMQRARYFPQPGDSPQVIAFKATLRRNAIEALQRSAGPAANGIETVGGATGADSPAAGVANAVLSGAADGAPNYGAPRPSPETPGAPPPDPNRVQPGESMGQVGTLPIPTSSEPNGQNVVSGEGGTMLTENDRHIAGMATALANSALPPDQAIAQINNILRTNGRNLLTPDQEQSIRSARANRTRHPGFAATPSGQSQGGVISQLGDTAGGAAAINYLDSASLGLPGLFSSDYREGVAAVRDAHPVASTVGAIAGGLVAPGGPRPGMNLAEQSLRSAGQGVAYGFNESGGDPAAAIVGGGIGAAAPGALNLAGRGVRGVRNALLPRGNYADPEAQALANALTQEQIPGSRPLLDPSRRDRMAYLESSVGSGGPIRQGLQATRTALEGRIDSLSQGGSPLEPGAMGQRIQSAANRDHTRAGVAAGRVYDAADTMAAQEGAPGIRPIELVAQLDNDLARLRRNPKNNAAVISYLENVRGDFVDAQGNMITKSIADIRDVRTGLRGDINHRNLSHTRAEHFVSQALDAAKADVQRDFGTTAPQALSLYNRADRMWRVRQENRRQIVERLTGPADNPISGKQVMDRVAALAAGDTPRLRRMWSMLEPDERRDLAATIASTAGRKSPQDPFQPGQFISWAATLQPSARAVVFGPEGARSIENLRRISQALKDTQSRLNNSRSGVVSNWRGWLRDLTGGGPVGAIAGLASGGSMAASGAVGAALGGASALTGLAVRRLSANALMNRDLSRWLAAAPRATTPSAISSHLARLKIVATRNPVISQEITGLRQALMNAMNDNAMAPMRAAASGPAGSDNRQEQ